ncbi:hypothetical protein C8R43DRAFT_602669 [Mycena crocata]|nr:hypothetical protein C8R43DRAFT_602669 [Mycena crocata]
MPNAYRMVKEAVRAGLFRAIVASAPDNTHETGPAIVVDLLGAYTVYYSVLSCIEPALHEVEHLQTASVFTHSDLFRRWSEFWDLAQERIMIMHYFESDLCISFKACDNSQCANIRRKRELRYCSSCRYQYYCSKDCQTIDWKDGHRSACRSSRQDRPEHLSTKDRSFLRALVDYDYKTRRLILMQWQLAFLQAFPDEIPCIVFDYTREHLQITFQGTHSLHVKWQDHVARARRSGGRIQLHFVRILNGKFTDVHAFPMQSSSTVWADGLERLRRELEEGVGGSAPIYVQLPRRISALTATTLSFRYSARSNWWNGNRCVTLICNSDSRYFPQHILRCMPCRFLAV